MFLPPPLRRLLLLLCVVSPVPALLHLLDVFPLGARQALPPSPRRPLLQPQGVAVLLQGVVGGAHHPQVVLVALAPLGPAAQLRRGLLAARRPGPAVQLSPANQLQRDTHEGAGEVRVLLGHAGVDAGVGGVEGADEEASVGAENALIQLDLEKQKGRLMNFGKKKKKSL